MSNIKENEEVNVYKLYGEDCSLSKDKFIENHNIKSEGLTTDEISSYTHKYGSNEIKQARPRKWYHYFLDSLLSPFNVILLGIIVLLCYTDIYLPEKPSYANIIVIIILVIASTLLEFFEEFRSNKAAENLKELVATTCRVIRNGREVLLPIKNITINDTVLLSAGSMLPADLRIIEDKDLYVSQSSLTGESEAVKKSTEYEGSLDKLDNISDLNNNNGYTATRTSTGESTFMGMGSTAWTWLILGIAAIAIVALVWYYSMQFTNKNNNRYE